MELAGSCQCGGVTFRVNSTTPVPYQRCYCSICRKQQGGGGYAINLAAETTTLRAAGHENITFYRARISNPGMAPHSSSAQRAFCRICGSALWLFDPRWPELIHPFASAIDTALPSPPTTTHIMLDFRASWVKVEAGDGDLQYARYPEESIEEWHARQGMWLEE